MTSTTPETKATDGTATTAKEQLQDADGEELTAVSYTHLRAHET